MARRKKGDVDSPVDSLISSAVGSDELPSELVEAGIDALDAAREPEPVDVSEVKDLPPSGEPEPEAPRRGRKPGGTNKPRAESEVPKTKRGAIEYAAKMKAERDAALAQAEANKGKNSAEAIERLTLALAAGGQMVGNIMAHRRGEHWKLEKNEADAFGGAWAVCLAPYADTLGESVPWVVALGVTYNIFAGRIQVDRKAEAERAEVLSVSGATA